MRLLTVALLCLSAPLSPAQTDPAAPVDPSRRNDTFRPSLTVPGERLPGPAERRFPAVALVETARRERETAALQDDRAAIDVRESREKRVTPPPAVERPEFARRESERVRTQDRVTRFDPAAQRRETPTVARYQDSLREATAVTKQRTPASLERTGFAQINRFVFRRDRPAPADDRIPSTPAGGTPAPRR